MPFRVTIATDVDSWFNAHLPVLTNHCEALGHEVRIVHQADDIPDGEIAFLLSFGQMVRREVRMRNRHNIVVHASDLPSGKGWSPVTWQVLEGRTEIAVTLFEAVDKVDAGPIYLSGVLKLDGSELVAELRQKQADVTLNLCRQFLDSYPEVLAFARPQDTEGESFYRRRDRDDSRLDPDKTLREQFALLRVSDPERYPAYVDLAGHRYLIRVERVEGETTTLSGTR